MNISFLWNPLCTSSDTTTILFSIYLLRSIIPSMDLNLELEILAVEHMHHNKLRLEQQKQQIIHSLRDSNILQYHHFLRRSLSTLKDYLMIGIPLGIVSAVATRSLFLYPSAINTIGYFVFSHIKNRAQPTKETASM